MEICHSLKNAGATKQRKLQLSAKVEHSAEYLYCETPIMP